MARRPEETPEKLCPQCGTAMWAVTIPGTGRLLNCPDCRVTMWGATLFTWKRQNETEKRVDIRDQGPNKYRSKKPCPECGQPMWALQEPGYGTRHQCEECRLTVLFGGAIARWRGPKREPS